MAVYEEALVGQRASIGADKVIPGTIRALAVMYYGSLGFRSMKPITQSTYRNIIERFCRETDKTAIAVRRQKGRDAPARAYRETHGRSG